MNNNSWNSNKGNSPKANNLFGPIMIDLQGIALTEAEKTLLQHPRVGGVLLFSRNYKDIPTLRALVQSIRENARKPLLIAVDHEGGRVWRFKEGFNILPAMRTFGIEYEQNKDNDKNKEKTLKKCKEAGHQMASELLACGIDLSLAPVLDLDMSLSTVIGDRAFHSDPNIISKLAGAFIDGMNNAGMQATGKHFPGHGGCIEDSHIAAPVDKRPLSALMQSDILPFKNLTNKLGAIMPAHVTYPEVDSVPTGFSKRWLQDVLRNDLQFNGVILSDCLSMKGAALGGDHVVRAQLALDAGCDMVILAQQERSVLEWVLNNLDRDTTSASNDRISNLKGRITF